MCVTNLRQKTIFFFLFISLPTHLSAVNEVKLFDALEMRWDFNSCGATGRFGPTQVR